MHHMHPMNRLNSGIKNRVNFLVSTIFLIQKVGTDSVNRADSGDIQIFIKFPGNPILKFLLEFCFILQITHYDFVITTVMLIYISRATFRF